MAGRREKAGRQELSKDIIDLLKTRQTTPETKQRLVDALEKDRGLINDVHKQTFDSQPLHLAAFTGNKDMVETLLDYGANVNAKTTKGLSPLHRACTAGHEPVVRTLLERQAKVDTVDNEGRTPLLAVSATGKEAMVKLLLDWKADVNFKNQKTKRTALHEAVEGQSLTCVDLLLKHKPELNAQDSDGNAPLHLAAQAHNNDIVSILLHAGARLDVKNEDNFTPYELGDRGVKRVIDTMKSDENKAALLESGEVKPKTVKWYICGRSGAGKTTLMKSCCRSFFARMKTKEKKADSPLKVEERTPGINVFHAEFGEAGELTAHDLAGQPEYFPAHGLFFNADNTIFSMVVSLEDDGEEMFRIVCYWLQFIIASLENIHGRTHRPGEPVQRVKPPLSLVMSRADKFQKLSTEKKGHTSSIGQLLLTNIIERFDDYFDIHRHVFTLNCQVSNSDGMKLFRIYLKTTKQKLIARQASMPTICHSVSRNVLPKLVSKGMMYTSRTDFRQRLRERVDHRLKDETVDMIIEYLHKQGQVFALKEKKDDSQAHTVVTNPNWLCSEVIGTVMAPVTFLRHITHTSDGSVNRAQLSDAFGSEFNIDDVIHMLKMLEICFQRGSDPNIFQFPCHLAVNRPCNVWLPDDRMRVYGGRRVECKDKIRTMISPVAFPRLQVRAQTQFNFGSRCMWRGGIKALDKNGCEILVQESAVNTSIDVVVRGVSGSYKKCSDTLKRVLSMIQVVLNETSPGTQTVELVLSSCHLSGMSEKPHCYSQDVIAKALETNGLVVDQSHAITETVYELLVDISKAITDGLSKEDAAGVRLNVGEGRAALFSVDVSNVSDAATKHVIDRAAEVSEAFIENMGTDRLFAQAEHGVAAVVAVSAKNTEQ